MKNTFIALLIVLLLGGGLYIYMREDKVLPAPTTSTSTTTTTGTLPVTNVTATGTPTATTDGSKTVLGASVSGNQITAYHFGNGAKELLFVGGIHGGYEWNTTLLAYELMDYLKANPSVIPSGIKITVIPVMNPDGLKKVTGSPERFLAKDVSKDESILASGRFNANNVDLSRNFDCDWKSTGVWQTKAVSGGSAVFSEPESKAIKSYVEKKAPAAVVVWYSAAGGVFASNCAGSAPYETAVITKAFATASGYPSYDSFDYYATTGDMVNWLAKKNIPAISVLLTNHTDTEWVKNKLGVEALIKYYSK